MSREKGFAGAAYVEAKQAAGDSPQGHGKSSQFRSAVRIAALMLLIASGPAAMADVLRVPSAYPTIQAAVDAARDGDTVLIADGLYRGPGNRGILIDNKPITLRSEAGSATCIIDCQRQDRGFILSATQSPLRAAVVEGVTIRNGRPSGASSGGGVVMGTSSTLRNCVITDCESYRGGGVATGVGATIEGCTIADNQGGGIVAGQGATIRDCTITRNEGIEVGGIDAAHEVTIERCTVTYNQNNRKGGGVHVESGLVRIVDSHIAFNRAEKDGGGIYSLSPLTLRRCVVEGNSTGGTGGGAVLHRADASACTFIGNVAESLRGGGIFGSGTFESCLIGGNRVTGGSGYQMALGGGASVGQSTFTNCTIAGNTSAGGGAGLHADDTTLVNCIVRDNKPDEISFNPGGEPLVRYSNVRGGWPGVANIDSDALFVGPPAGDYRLSPGSPCIDAGDTRAVAVAATIDASGGSRCVDDGAAPNAGAADPYRPPVDMGAFERLSDDCNQNGVPDAEDIAVGQSADCDADGVPDECQMDCDGNGLLDACERMWSEIIDCNGNGRFDACDIAGAFSDDCNGNAMPDECEPDCNGNGAPDDSDVSSGFSQDCNGNGMPDECDIAAGLEADCNGNGVPDECDLLAGTSDDCNANGIPDECDVIRLTAEFAPLDAEHPHVLLVAPAPPATSQEVRFRVRARGDLGEQTQFLRVGLGAVVVRRLFNANGLACPAGAQHAGFELPRAAFNERLQSGALELRISTSASVVVCPASFAQVDIEYGANGAADCNRNGLPDSCDIAAGRSPDVNGNGIPDECDEVLGDLNCDLFVDAQDVEPFVLAVFDPLEYASQHPGCDRAHADLNGDGAVNAADIPGFVELLAP